MYVSLPFQLQSVARGTDGGQIYIWRRVIMDSKVEKNQHGVTYKNLQATSVTCAVGITTKWRKKASTPQIDVLFLWMAKWFLGDTLLCARWEWRLHSSDVMQSERHKERGRDVIDTESLFENNGALFCLYFQPTLYLLEELWDKLGFQAAVVWACYRPHPAPPAGVEMPLRLIISLGLTVQETVYQRGWKEFLWHTSSWTCISHKIHRNVLGLGL